MWIILSHPLFFNTISFSVLLKKLYNTHISMKLTETAMHTWKLFVIISTIRERQIKLSFKRLLGAQLQPWTVRLRLKSLGLGLFWDEIREIGWNRGMHQRVRIGRQHPVGTVRERQFGVKVFRFLTRNFFSAVVHGVFLCYLILLFYGARGLLWAISKNIILSLEYIGASVIFLFLIFNWLNVTTCFYLLVLVHLYHIILSDHWQLLKSNSDVRREVNYTFTVVWCLIPTTYF